MIIFVCMNNQQSNVQIFEKSSDVGQKFIANLMGHLLNNTPFTPIPFQSIDQNIITDQQVLSTQLNILLSQEQKLYLVLKNNPNEYKELSQVRGKIAVTKWLLDQDKAYIYKNDILGSLMSHIWFEYKDTLLVFILSYSGLRSEPVVGAHSAHAYLTKIHRYQI